MERPTISKCCAAALLAAALAAPAPARAADPPAAPTAPTPAAPAPAAPAPDAQRPSFIHIVLDDWGYYEWGGMGHGRLHTPRIDRFAAEGMRFTQMLAGGAVGAASRSALLTGRHTGHTALRSNRRRRQLRDADVTLAEVLRGAGYATAGFGKWGVGDRGTSGAPERQGFELFFGYYHPLHAITPFPRYLVRNGGIVPQPGNGNGILRGAAFSHAVLLRAAKDWLRAQAGRPFYLYLPWTPPHGLWGLPGDDPAWQRFRDIGWNVPGEYTRSDAQRYAALLAVADRSLGEVLDLLGELGIADSTLVILSGDNGGHPYFRNRRHPAGFFAPNVDPKTGARFRGGKGSLYEGGLRIPFLARWPGRIQAGAVSGHLGYLPDVLPTLSELAGAEAPPQTDGISLLPTLLGAAEGAQRQHRYLYWEDDRAGEKKRLIAVRMGEWKALRTPRRLGFSHRWSLYHLGEDPGEQNDLSRHRPEVLAALRAFAEEAHEPPQNGEVLDSKQAFGASRTGRVLKALRRWFVRWL